MKMVVVGNPDAVMGFSLVGIQGYVATSGQALNEVLDKILTQRNIGVILVTSEAAQMDSERIERIKLHPELGPILVEIPGPEGFSDDNSDLARAIQRSTGIRL
ncbi:MAG: V-type ATP synthase subunit F [Anaerolineae bacterium]|nr:V-type ATP synthase subunit F [Anaerolineae bacterium]